MRGVLQDWQWAPILHAPAACTHTSLDVHIHDGVNILRLNEAHLPIAQLKPLLHQGEPVWAQHRQQLLARWQLPPGRYDKGLSTFMFSCSIVCLDLCCRGHT